MRIGVGERGTIGLEQSRIVGKTDKNEVRARGEGMFEVGTDRIQAESESMITVDTLAKLAESGGDIHILLDQIKNPQTLMNYYREATQKLDPSMDDARWNAWDKVTLALREKVSPKRVEVSAEEPAAVTLEEVDDDTIDEQSGEILEDVVAPVEVAEVTPNDTLEETVENNEPSLDQKVTGIKEVLRQKEKVLREVKNALRGGEFTFNQGDPDWLQACGELLADSGLVNPEMARQILESAQEVKQINDKKLRGDERNDAIVRLQRRIGIVQKGLTGRKAEATQLDAKISQQVLFEQATFSDFEQLMGGKDLGSRFSGLEGYWKNMQKFLSIDSRLSGAKAVVDEVLNRKIFSAPANEKGLNPLLSQKKRELEIAVRNAQTLERAA